MFFQNIKYKVQLQHKYIRNTNTVHKEIHLEIQLYYCVDRGDGARSDWRAGSDQETWSSALSTLNNTSFLRFPTMAQIGFVFLLFTALLFKYFLRCHKLDLLQMTSVGCFKLVRLAAAGGHSATSLCPFNCWAPFEKTTNNNFSTVFPATQGGKKRFFLVFTWRR